MKNKQVLLSLFLMITIGSSALGQWSWLNPIPGGDDHFKVTFINSDTGFIINNYKVIRTVDGGENWNIVQEFPNINDIAFDNETGYIVCQYGKAYKSQDYGISWNEVELPYLGFGNHPNSVHLFTKDTIIISGGQFIVRSFNEGLDWEIMEIEDDRPDKTIFLNPQIGHAICNANYMGHDKMIKKTIDGGVSWDTTWLSDHYSFDMRSIYFYNDSIGYAFNEYYGMLKTIDFGESWEDIYYYGTQDINSFAFVSEETGYAAGEHGQIYKTYNGGQDWEKVSIQNTLIYGTHLSSIYFTEYETGIVVGEHGRIYKTENGGQNWIPSAFTYKSINNISLPTENIAYAGMANQIIKSTDACQTWEVLNIDIDVTVKHLQFVDEQTGYWVESWGAGYDNFYKTNDGCTTKEYIDMGFDYDGISSLFFVNSNEGYVCFNDTWPSDHEGVYKTINGSNTWFKVSDETGFAKISFVNSYTGFALKPMSWDRALFKTIDGGQTWESILENNNSSEITAFSFVNEDVGYAVGDNHFFASTADGGNTWETDYFGSSSESNIIKFYTKDVGVLLSAYSNTNDAVIYQTTDGGLNWDRIEFTGINQFNDATILDDGRIFVIGNYGLVMSNDLSSVSIDEHGFSDNHSKIPHIFPNPTNTKISLKSNVINDIKYIYITDMNNRIIKKLTYNGKNTIDVSRLNKGLYLIVIVGDNAKLTEKLVIN